MLPPWSSFSLSFPSIKNKYEFNFFGNGTLDIMSGLVYWNDDLREKCI